MAVTWVNKTLAVGQQTEERERERERERDGKYDSFNMRHKVFDFPLITSFEE
jgi:hypothetical protein